MDVPNAITLVLGILAIPSIFIGFYTKDMIVGFGTEFFGTAIYVPLNNTNIFDSEFVPLFYKLLPVNLSLFGATLSFVLYSFQYKTLFAIKTSFFNFSSSFTDNSERSVVAYLYLYLVL